MRRFLHSKLKTQNAKLSGFTLVEMIVVLVVTMIVFAMMLPALAPLMASKGVEGGARLVQGGVMQARALAAKNNKKVTISFHTNLARDNVSSWFAIYGDTAGPTDVSSPDEDKQIGPRYTLPEGVAFFSITNSFNFALASNWDSNGPKADFFNGFTNGNNPASVSPCDSTCTDTYCKRVRNVVYTGDGLSAGNGDLSIVVAKEGKVALQSYYDNRLSVVLHTDTQMPEVIKQ